jgi:hypothetical protein
MHVGGSSIVGFDVTRAHRSNGCGDWNVRRRGRSGGEPDRPGSAGERARERAGREGRALLGVHAEGGHRADPFLAGEEMVNLTDQRAPVKYGQPHFRR